MNAVDTNGQLPEHKPEPTDEAGCESEVSRNVQGTGLPGFAELRDSVFVIRNAAACMAIRSIKNPRDSVFNNWSAIHELARDIDERINVLEADAKDETRQELRITTSEAVP